jgi:tetratricopeptide (TPR) repeat protein
MRLAVSRITVPLICFVGLAAVFAVAPPIAFGEGTQGGGSKAQEEPAPSGKYAQTCAQGNAKYVARDFPAAIALYRSAIEHDPKDPLGYYLLGAAQLAAGNIPEADASWNRALTSASDKDPAMRARILFVIADLKERQWKWDDAKTAWQAYLDYTARFPNAAAFPASAHSRQQVIDAMLKQDKAYDIVRKRIAATKDGGVFSDLSKSP